MSRLMQSTVPLMQSRGAVQQAWDYIHEPKVEDREIAGTYEQPQMVTLTLTRQDEFILKVTPVKGLQISTVSGELGIRAGMEYKISKLIPGVIAIEKTEGQPTTNYFTSGGFAHINNDGSVDINTVECVSLDDVEPAYVDRELAIATEAVKSAKNDKERVVAEVQVQTYEALQAALKQYSGAH